MANEEHTRLFLCGDVMTGRGIDQILPHSVDPRLFEGFVKDARTYVELAEEAHGDIPGEVDYGYVWGDALEALAERGARGRIANLETAVTTSDEAFEDKGVHYRMHPENAPVLEAAGIRCASLANNHAMDWGPKGLLETLDTLQRARIAHPGAGRDLEEAAAPALVELSPERRAVVIAAGSLTSGIPPEWAAQKDRPGVSLLESWSDPAAEIAARVREVKKEGDLAVASIHWGSNWGWSIPRAQGKLARRLIDEAGIDIVHGHSSHHVKAIEVHSGRLVLYGCGDLLTDYEGIAGHESFRGDLGLMYFPELAPDGRLAALRMVPTTMRRFQIVRASKQDARWLAELLTREGAELGTSVEFGDGDLGLNWK